MDEHDDQVENVMLDRLRAADPAARSFTDLDRLRQKVDARIAAGSGDAEPPPAPAGTTGTVTEIGAARSRRSRWLSVAAVAAAAAVVGVTGFGLGRGTAEPPPGAAPPISLATGIDGGGGPETSGRGAEAAASDASMTWPAGGGRTTFRGAGLSEEGGSATAWGFDATSSFTAERVTEVAAALGVEGPARLVDGSWQAGSTDGTAPYVTVFPDGQSGLNYYNPAADPFRCVGISPMPVEPGDGEAVVEPDSAERDAAGAAECQDVDLGPAPAGDAATDRVRALLGEMGLDPAAYEIEATTYEETATTSVTAHEVVAGQRSGAAWWFDLTGAGLLGVNGSLAPLTELGAYPVVGPAEAVARLNDPRFGSIGGFTLDAASSGGPETSSDVAAEPPPGPGPGEPPAPAAAGSPVPWPVEDVTITSARLGVAQHHTASGAALLVPAYELTADDGRTWSVLAVAESALDLTPAR